MKNSNALTIASAVASMFAAQALAGDKPPAPKEAKPAEVHCEGVNSCKGTGACGGAGHGCAGQNACKGQGWVSMSEKDCKAKGGKIASSK
jgi:hypothetical protein